MSFLSFTYLFFLLGTAALYWALRERKARNLLLLAASYAFYGYAQAWYPLLLLASTAGAYVSAIVVSRNPARKTAVIWWNVALNVGVLCLLKYASAMAGPASALLHVFGWQVAPETLAIALPLGTSFFTLQALGYVIDVADGKCAPRKGVVDVALFMALFPKLVSGPLERGEHLLPQLEKTQKFQPSFAGEGAYLIARGFMKKMAIADNLKLYVDQVYGQEHPLFLMLVAATAVYSVQILADFSGYTDIARGSAKFFGIDLFENFRFPYRAVSPSDFWRRWHISLSNWFRDYVYIPLGGSRTGSQVRFFAILMITMSLSGAWHGASANFLAWGAYHGLLLYAYNALGYAGKWQPAKRTGTAAAVAIMYAWTLLGWMIFRCASLPWLAGALLRPSVASLSAQVSTSIMLLLLCAVFSAGWVIVTLLEKTPWRFSKILCFWLMILVIGMMTSVGAGNFIYFRF